MRFFIKDTDSIVMQKLEVEVKRIKVIVMEINVTSKHPSDKH